MGSGNEVDERPLVFRTDDVADLTRAVRRRAFLGQRDLARLAGVPQSAISAYERGRRVPPLAVLQRLALAAGFELQVGLVRADPAGRHLTGPHGQALRRAKTDVLEVLADAGVRRVWVVGPVATGAEERWDTVDLVIHGGPQTATARLAVQGRLTLVLPARTTLTSSDAWLDPSGGLAVPAGAVELVPDPVPDSVAGSVPDPVATGTDDLDDLDDLTARRWPGPDRRRAPSA